MISTKNPFPGMNPFLEDFWPGVHTALINAVQASLADRLPLDLHARSEERVLVDGDIDAQDYRVDVALTENWKQGVPPLWNPDQNEVGGIAVTEPELIRSEPHPERWVEIRTAQGKLVTAIEIISPSNKLGDGRVRYKQKQRDYLQSGVNLVEIDLLRAGAHVVAVPEETLRTADETRFIVCAHRAARPGWHEVYKCPLRKRLPVIRIPLRATDKDVVLDLQPLVDRCYELGRYWQEDYKRNLSPALPAEEAAWVNEQLAAAGLR